MNDTPPARTPELLTQPRRSGSLRLRLWIACLGGVLATAAAVAWLLGTASAPDGTIDLRAFSSRLLIAASGGVIVGALLALWIDRVLIVHLRGLATSVASTQVAELRGLPAAAGWGELSELTQRIQLLVTHHRQATRGVEELAQLREQLGAIRGVLERWLETERWPGLRVDLPATAPIAEALNRGLRRLDEVREQNEEAARQVGRELSSALDDARESAEQAERGFVEATSLLTTVRELQRLGGELSALVGPGARAAGAPRSAAVEAYQSAARSAIEELVESSSGSVEHLGRGVLKVREIADQVYVLANRSTLIALHAALGGESAGPSAETAEDLRRLAAEVRTATDHTNRLAREVEDEANAAMERMRGVRERVGDRLEKAPAFDTGAPPSDEAARLLGRVREMIQDATQKGERLSAAGERVSRAAERLLRGLEEEAGEIDGLVARLAPPAPAGASALPPANPGGKGEPPRSGLRLLGTPEPDETRPRRPGAAGEERS